MQTPSEVFGAVVESQVILHVTYRGASDARFDRDYYVGHHLPLVMKAFG